MTDKLIINFGKSHKGESIIDLVKTEPIYCKWLYSQPWLETNNPDIYNYLSLHLTKEQLIPFGKYKNKTIEEIRILDDKYIIWLKKNEWVKENLKEIYNSL